MIEKKYFCKEIQNEEEVEKLNNYYQNILNTPLLKSSWDRYISGKERNFRKFLASIGYMDPTTLNWCKGVSRKEKRDIEKFITESFKTDKAKSKIKGFQAYFRLKTKHVSFVYDNKLYAGVPHPKIKMWDLYVLGTPEEPVIVKLIEIDGIRYGKLIQKGRMKI